MVRSPFPTFPEHRVNTNTGVVDLDTCDVVVVGVVLFQHVHCNVRNVLSSIRFTSDVDLPTSQVESSHEVFPKSSKVSANVGLVLNRVRGSFGCWRETCTDRLVDPYHVCEVGPRERVWLWSVCSTLPQYRAILLEKAVQGAAARTTVQPNGNLVRGRRVL